jgi:hypothetical protein
LWQCDGDLGGYHTKRSVDGKRAKSEFALTLVVTKRSSCVSHCRIRNPFLLRVISESQMRLAWALLAIHWAPPVKARARVIVDWARLEMQPLAPG